MSTHQGTEPFRFVLFTWLLISCMSPRDRQVEGLIRLREAKRGYVVGPITVEGASARGSATLIYFNFITKAPVLEKRYDSILVSRNMDGIYREIP